MTKKFSKLFALVVMVSLFAVGPALADSEQGRITAEQAFEAVQTQKDPISGEAKNVVMVDVRTRAEYYWVGAACKVNEITLDDETKIVPDLGKASLISDGRIILFRQNGWPRLVPVKMVKSVDLSPIAINIPYKLWDEATGKTTDNPYFLEDVEALALDGAEVVIFFCRSGGRSQDCLTDFNTTVFEAIYEIDRPDLQDGFGGFEGTSYGNVHLGYRGFPQRDTRHLEAPSVSWKDSGLPTKTGVNPFPQP